MSPERKSTGFKKHIEKLVRGARSSETWQDADNLLRARIPDFDRSYGQHISILREYFELRRDIHKTQDYSKVEVFEKKYTDPESLHFDAEHPEILKELKEPRSIIRGIFNHKKA